MKNIFKFHRSRSYDHMNYVFRHRVGFVHGNVKGQSSKAFAVGLRLVGLRDGGRGRIRRSFLFPRNASSSRPTRAWEIIRRRDEGRHGGRRWDRRGRTSAPPKAEKTPHAGSAHSDGRDASSVRRRGGRIGGRLGIDDDDDVVLLRKILRENVHDQYDDDIEVEGGQNL